MARRKRLQAHSESLSAEGIAESLSSAPALAVAYSKRVGQQWHAWPYLGLIWDAVIEAINDPDGGRLIVNVPPRHGKSHMLSWWVPTWLIGVCPQLRVILASYQDTFAASWGRKVRDTIRAIPELEARVRDDVSATAAWETEQGGGMVCSGPGGAITGKGANCILIDDILKNEEEARSPVIRKKAQDWFSSTLLTRTEPGASIIILQTRWHQDDLCGHLLREQPDKWKHLRLPAIADSIDDPLHRMIGQSLCPDRYDEKALMQKRKEVGERTWAGLYQQLPSPAEGNILQRQWIKYYDIAPAQFDEQIQSWDLTFKELGSSFVVGQLWGRRGADFFLVDQLRGRWGFSETCKQIIEFSRKHPRARVKLIEDKANGPAVLDALKSRIPGLIAVKPDGGKEARCSAVSPLFESGNVFIPSTASSPWVAELVEEWVSFPSSANDDQVDAMSQALTRLSKKKGWGSFSMSGNVSLLNLS
jgi:predicted phage terminase large subunit-like protein